MSVVLMHGDCLEKMKNLPDGAIDLILTDPPYGTIKGMTGIRADWDTPIDFNKMFAECFRVLRPNGVLILFGQEPFTSKLILGAHGSLPFSHRLNWVKEHFATAFNVSKVPANYTEDIVVYYKRCDDFRDHPLKPWFDAELVKSGFTRSQMVKKLGSSAGHYFTDGRQFSIPSESKLQLLQYETGYFKRSYADLKAVDMDYRNRLRQRWPRVFNLAPGKKFKSNILYYKRDLTGLHPTQKPLALIKDLLFTYSAPNSKVLDFTMGSGTTGVGCVEMGRDFYGIEKDDMFFTTAENRINTAMSASR
ncbi:DNA-methyltransferase [Grimontia marina]|uniref:Methyltransferase n=1 Tax=Grimontia marina TaxID=646534 RepID=A0A128F8N8_9GAMM|nr:site-specific DNA-methyltransferase [Grimontia marina]CZF83177.1 DNA adenine methyltransferase YhdJ [Grimontia marina]